MTIYPSRYIKRFFITEYPFPKLISTASTFDKNVFGKLETAGIDSQALKPAQYAFCTHGGEGGHEQPSKTVAKKLVYEQTIFIGFQKTIPGFD
jgi:hypothetical protein